MIVTRPPAVAGPPTDVADEIPCSRPVTASSGIAVRPMPAPNEPAALAPSRKRWSDGNSAGVITNARERDVSDALELHTLAISPPPPGSPMCLVEAPATPLPGRLLPR